MGEQEEIGMLTLTREAAQAIRELMDATGVAGVRLHAGSRRFFTDSGPSILIEITQLPDVEDTVLEVEGARIYLGPETLRTLDDKVLHADLSGDEVRFAVFAQQPAQT
jgi:Fe-S cluster assembly iron-binding protein IscA